MLTKKCVNCNSTNIVMIVKKVFRTRKAAAEIKTIHVKCRKCKLCGVIIVPIKKQYSKQVLDKE